MISTVLNLRRKILESQYDATCNIIEYKSFKNGEFTDKKEKTIFENQPCRLSFEDIYSNSESDTQSITTQKVKLFISPDIEIPSGCKIDVTRLGKTKSYKSSGEPAIYFSHQEIILELFKVWA